MTPDSSIRLLILVNSMEKGGRTKVIAEEFAGLSSDGHDVRLITFSEPPSWICALYPQSKDWIYLPKRQGKFDFMLFVRLIKFVLKHKIQVIHAHCEASAMHAGLISKLTRMRSVATVHRSDFSYFQNGLRNKIYFGLLDSVLAVSSERKTRMVNELGISEDKIYIMHWGVNPLGQDCVTDLESARTEAGVPSGVPVILSLGHLGPIKGHDESIRAVSIVKQNHPNVRLYIGGDGADQDYERLQSLITELGMQDTVHLLGQITNPMVWLQACDVFLLPSREEAFGLVFIEAGLCKKPTVATNIGGIPDIVIDGQTGCLVKPESPNEIATTLGKLLDSESESLAMGEAAYQRVNESFLLEHQISKLESYLKSIIGLAPQN